MSREEAKMGEIMGIRKALVASGRYQQDAADGLVRVYRKDLPECGARCRDGHSCRRKVVPGRTRCANHGGLSCGPRTEAGRAAIAESNRRRAAALRR